MSNTKLSSNSLLSENFVADFKSQYEGLWTGTANANSNISWGTTAVDPNWHQGGIVPPDYKSNSTINVPTRYVEINCLFCNSRFSTPLMQQRCWMAMCVSCMNSFRLHLETCDPECDQRVDCLLNGILSNISLKPIIDIQGIRQPEIPSQWIINPNSSINWNYHFTSDLYVIKYENPYAPRTVQDNGFKGDPFQLPDVSKR